MRRAFSEARLQAIEVRVTTEGEAMKVETIYPPAEKGMLGDRSGTVDYVILVPQKWSLAKVELERGEVLIEGMYGPRVEVAVGSGLLHLNSCFSTINALLGEGRLIFFMNGGSRSLSPSRRKCGADRREWDCRPGPISMLTQPRKTAG